MEKRIGAVEMWLDQKMFQISWVDQISIEQVLQRSDTKREIVTIIRQRQLRFLGHTMREQQLEMMQLTGSRQESQCMTDIVQRGASMW